MSANRLNVELEPKFLEEIREYCRRNGKSHRKFVEEAGRRKLDGDAVSAQLAEDAANERSIRKKEEIVRRSEQTFEGVRKLAETLMRDLPKMQTSGNDRVIAELSNRTGTTETRKLITETAAKAAAEGKAMERRLADVGEHRHTEVVRRLEGLQAIVEARAGDGLRLLLLGAGAALALLLILGFLGRGTAPAFWIATKLTGEQSGLDGGARLAGRSLPANGESMLRVTAMMLTYRQFYRSYDVCLRRAAASVGKPVTCKVNLPAVQP